ncbi:MAG: hypothetical protein JW726_17210 [Anaerolineales bacterium]|nr:hypothetical protein [Anaerolineales bacterium]
MKHKTTFAVLLSISIAFALPTLGMALIGDLDISGVVDDPDMEVVSAAYGSHSWNPISPNWNALADINQSDKVDLVDLTIFGYNYGDGFNFHGPRRVSTSTNVFFLDAAADNMGNIHIVYGKVTSSPDDPLYYTKVDSAGNPLIEDLWIDNGNDPRLAVDEQGTVHIVWQAEYDDANDKTGVLYTQLDAEGRAQVWQKVVCDFCEMPAIDTDSYGHAHIVAVHESRPHVLYMILDSIGTPLLTPTRINTQYGSSYSSLNPEIAIGPDGARHILWYEDTPGESGELFYTRIPVGDIPSINQALVTHITSWNSHRLAIEADSQGAAHILWHDYRETSDTVGSIFWKRINPDGTMTNEIQITNGCYHETPLVVTFSIDDQDRLHYGARSEKIDVGYGMIDRDGGILIPYQTVYYHDSSAPRVVSLPDGQAAVAFVEYNGQYGVNPVFVMSTVADPASFDTTRPDLVIDRMHAGASPWIARIVDQATITVTVSNGGWVDASDITLTFEETVGGTSIAPESIASIPQYGSVTVVRTFDIPDFEDVTAMPIRIEASTSTAETTLVNNVLTLTMGIIPPAHSFDISVASFDETYAPDDRNLAAYLISGTLTLEVPSLGYEAEVTSTHAYNGFIGVPLDPAGGATMTTLVHLTLTAPGYTTAVQDVTAARFASDPYRVLLTPASPVKMYVNQWGEIQGVVYTGTTTTPLSGVTVNLDDGRSTTTNANGEYSFTKVVSGSHTIETWHAGNAPTSKTVQVVTSGTATPTIQMPPTTRGYVRGVVTNDLGRPFTGITVVFKGDGSQIDTDVTDDQGAFSFEVADVHAYTSYTLEATCGICDPFVSTSFAPLAGIPEIYDFTLHWTVTTADLQTNADVTSWEQVERYNKLDEDNLNVGQLILYKVADAVNKLENYEVDVWWGEYHYALGLNYNESGGTYTIQNLGIDLANYGMYSYDVQGGSYHAGVEDINRTSLRVERVDLVQIDSNHNVSGDALWYDDTMWYANSEDGTPTWQMYDISTAAESWSTVAVRIFLRVGQYTNENATHWKAWAPPVAVASLSGSGSGAGTDYQVLIWDLSSNSVDVFKSMAYYADVVGGATATSEAVIEPQAVSSPQAVTVSLEFPNPLPARIGSPFPVDVVISGASDSPVFAIEFGMSFDPAYLQVIEVVGGEDFDSIYGPGWGVTPALEEVSASGSLSGAAAVRLGSVGGISEGVVARVYFMPRAVTDLTSVALEDVLLATEGAETFSAGTIGPGLDLEVDLARLLLPMLYK